MTDFADRLLNQSARKLALLGERLRATPYQCFLAEPIAVVGVGCRFPGAAGPDAFWKLLVEGRDAITEVPPDRWPVDAWYDPDPQAPGKSYSRRGGFLDRVDEFDAAYFGISPREARHMDPRQRILLETAAEALADAGVDPERLSGTHTGVFVGHMVGDYYSLETGNVGGIDSYVGTGNLDAVLANRLSYVMDLRGPSVAVDTACSSSLVALYLACQSLRADECQTAIAGGVNLMLTPEMHVVGAKSLLLSPEGRCKTFDRGADGFVRGEGCGLLVLKRLADALAAGDDVLAVVRGIAVNQDGRTNGISAPNGLSQQRVIRRALHNALLEPSHITMVEAHGTGTVVGDAIEFEALAEVYGRASPHGPCYLGAVKTNLGHLEGASGAAGVIKLVLCLRHGLIPPNLNFRQLNPHLALSSTRFRLPLETHAWLTAGEPRRGAVSSFGLGGTNAHAILEQAPQRTDAVRREGRERPVFRRQSYWLKPRDTGRESSGDLTDLMYRVEWPRVPLAKQADKTGAGDWLIVENRNGGAGRFCGALAGELNSSGWRARVATEFLPPAAGPYRGVVYLHDAAGATDAPADAEAAGTGLLHLVQALARAGVAPRLAVVTRGAQPVDPSDVVDPAQASLWGLARTVRLEHPEFQCASIDLAADEEDPSHVAAELLAADESQVAFRNGARHVARLSRHAAEVHRPPPAIRETGCYLITGGLGALGLSVARQLVSQGARRIVLAGRTDRPIQPVIEDLRSAGAVAQVVLADVTRAAEVARLIAASQAHGPLHGVVHAAGVLDDGVLENQTSERFAGVMAPKARGAWELHLQTRAIPLDFFVCFSSMASLLGSAGQAPYAAANAFLDGLAHLRRSRGLPALALNWGPWADAGMAARLHSRLQAHGEGMIDPALGARLFAHALAQAAAQLGAMRVDWARYAATYPAPEFLERLTGPASAKQAPSRPDVLDRLRAAPVGRRVELLTEFVQSQAATVLGHPAHAVSRTQGFAHMGMDSLGSIDLRTRLEKALGCRLPTTLAFDFPNIDALAGRLVRELHDIAFEEAAEAPPAGVAAAGEGDLEDLTRDELATLLARELSTLQEGTTP